MDIGYILAFSGATLSILLAGIGSVLGCAATGQAANGAMEEHPKRFGSFLPAAALPGSQGIYGFVIAFMITQKMNSLGNITFYTGLALLASSLPIAIVGLISAIYQAKVCTTGIELMKTDETALGKVLTLAVFPELYAILSLLVSIFLLAAVK
jgi:V/A-type H+-transporting ATPase subunit K